MADGPVIQRASEQALAAGIGLGDVLAAVAAFRERDAATPVVLMGYCNPVERMGAGGLRRARRAAGVDGVLLVDCPPEEAGGFAAPMRSSGMDSDLPAGADQRDGALRSRSLSAASGYVYYVSLKGVTGAGNIDTAEVAAPGAADPAGDAAAGRRRLRHQGRRHCGPGGGVCRRRGHRHAA